MKAVAPEGPSTIKGTVASTSTSPTTGFTLDVAGCATPQFIATTSSTTYSEPGTGTTPTAVVAGEHVIVQLVRGASMLTAGHVTILLAELSGTVDSASASQLLVTDQQGFKRTIDLDVNGTTVSFPTGATVADGDLVDGFGTVDGDHSALDAVAIHVRSAPTPRTTPPTSSNHVSGVVASVTPGVSFVLDQADGTSETITTTTDTKYDETGAPSPPTTVASGEHVDVQLVPGAATPTAKSVAIVLTELDGTVESVGSSSFVLQDSQGFGRTVDVSTGTRYSPSSTTLAGLVGDHVAAFGTVDPDLTELDAAFVHVLPTAASTWFDTQPWKGVPSGCPVTPPVPTTFHPPADPHGTANSSTHDTGASPTPWSSGPNSAGPGSGSRDAPDITANTSNPGHGNSDPQSSGPASGNPPSFSGSPGSPASNRAPVPQGGGQGGPGRGGDAPGGGAAGGPGRGGGGPGGGR